MNTGMFKRFRLNLLFLVGLIALVGTGCTTHITEPEDGELFWMDDVITFSGYGINIFGLSLQDHEMTWVSSIDGELGKGSSITKKLSVGDHVITLEPPIKGDLNYVGSSIIDISVIDLNDGLVAYFPFNGNTNDESGNGHHGAENGGVSLAEDRFGASNSAYFFDGTDDYISVADHENLQLGSNGSITFWVSAASIEPFNSMAPFISKGGDQYTDDISIGINMDGDSTKELTFAFNREPNGDTLSVSDYKRPFDLHTWTLVCGIWDSSGFKLYEDDRLVRWDLTPVEMIADGYDLLIGAAEKTSMEYGHCTIDDIRI